MSEWRKEVLGINNKPEHYVIRHIIKRDGQLEIYNRGKLFDAIMEGMESGRQ